MFRRAFCIATACTTMTLVAQAAETAPASRPVVCEKADGYRGIWSAGGELPGEYKYQFSGGLATFSPQHVPMAIHADKPDKTFFVYGGMPADGHQIEENRRLLIMVSCFDHQTGTAARPRILLDRQTDNAFENPTLSMDSVGRPWVFVGCHGTARPSYVFRSTEPYSIDSFSLVAETTFSMPQPWYLEKQGFILVHTLHDGPINRLCAMTSKDGMSWSQPNVLASIEAGHNHVSWRYKDKIGIAFDYCPRQGAGNARTNLYYMETRDAGKTWVNVKGERLDLPLSTVDNKALVRSYEDTRRLVYVKDLTFDARGNPIILFLIARGYRPGPLSSPRIWTTARWRGRDWEFAGVIRSDNNLEAGCLFIDRMDRWWLIAPTDKGAAPFYLGGEVVAWFTRDQGASWARWTFTEKSEFNHTGVHRPVDASPGFWVFWADGDARQPSPSRLYFADRDGIVYRLPTQMTEEFEKPAVMPIPSARRPARTSVSDPATEATTQEE
ncbi:MAG TPA: BNR-4 repeat-containing protein [Phycisphaerae bacterium]|nr:BNR-4 repeat-containing protein [Phycisphaerae bacterium]HRR84243.1 BNR-4 repeat-containing protein [Phycisphaerae bacterium]